MNEPIESEQLEPIVRAFHEQLLACLQECAAGRFGLFTDFEHVDSDYPRYSSWPEAARLRELALALQSILAQAGASDPLCDRFLDLCTIHGEHDPGEPRLARGFLGNLDGAL